MLGVVLELALRDPSLPEILLRGTLSMLEFLCGDEERDSIGEVFVA